MIGASLTLVTVTAIAWVSVSVPSETDKAHPKSRP